MVFADNSLENSQQLPQTLLDRLLETLLALWREGKKKLGLVTKRGEKHWYDGLNRDESQIINLKNNHLVFQ